MGFCFASNRALKKVSFAKSTFNVPRRPVSICEEKKSLSDLSQTQDEWRMSNHRQLFSFRCSPSAFFVIGANSFPSSFTMSITRWSHHSETNAFWQENQIEDLQYSCEIQ